MKIFLFDAKKGMLLREADVYDPASAKHYQKWRNHIPDEGEHSIDSLIELRFNHGDFEIVKSIEFSKPYPEEAPVSREKRS